MDFINEIKSYILFLKGKCNLEITLHPIGSEQLISNSELIAFNIHENPHCIYIKTFPSAHEHCVSRQGKIKEKCRNGSFCGSCYAGVFEYVYPIYDGVSQTGFVSVSGYRGNNYSEYIDKVSADYEIPIDNLRKTAQCLNDNLPEKEYIDTIIAPLIRMLELAYIKSNLNKTKNAGIDNVLRYINRHYAEDITLESVCDALSYSRSSISHTFKQVTGRSFREYLTEIRLRSAKSLLSHSKLSVTEISYAVGFSDSNYFSNVFKAQTGMPPTEYRKRHR